LRLSIDNRVIILAPRGETVDESAIDAINPFSIQVPQGCQNPAFSMSHPLVAAVWEQLGRRDVGNILREIIGEHAAELAVVQMQDDVSRTEPLIRPVLWIKAIFDLQRAYLQGLTNVHDCHPYFLPYLLPSEAIFSTLMYLIRVKSDLFPSNTPAPPDFARHRHFIAQVLLGGIRLLLLRGDAIPPDLRFNLERVMRAAWHHPDLSSAESYLIMDLLPRAIDQIGSPELSKKQSTLLTSNNTSLPSFASGLVSVAILIADHTGLI
jgi:hypothetical protein